MPITRTPFRDIPAPSSVVTGGDIAWQRLIPLIWHALADASGTHLWPERPLEMTYGDADRLGPQAWFSPALHLLCFSSAGRA